MSSQDKRKYNEYRKNPMANFADAINRSIIGDLGTLTQSGCLGRIITTAIIIVALYFLLR